MRILCLSLACAILTAPTAHGQRVSALTDTIQALTGRSGGTVAVVAIDLASGDTLAVLPDLRFHAASTMKVPVLIELARRIQHGDFAWDDSLPVRNQFASIVDGSSYRLDPADDSDSTVYRLDSGKSTIRRLAEHMIERSSNLSTNILIGMLDPQRVNQTAHELGADSIAVLRGVEDQKAFDQGLNNTTTARDLARLLGAIAQGRAAGPGETAEMLRILSAQEFNDGIPAGLPPGVRVAHKTGEITGIAHDAAIIFPPNRAPLILVVLTRGFADHARATGTMAAIAGIIYRGVTNPP